MKLLDKIKTIVSQLPRAELSETGKTSTTTKRSDTQEGQAQHGAITVSQSAEEHVDPSLPSIRPWINVVTQCPALPALCTVRDGFLRSGDWTAQERAEFARVFKRRAAQLTGVPEASMVVAGLEPSKSINR